MAGAEAEGRRESEAEGRRESEAEAEDEWASEAEGVPLTSTTDLQKLQITKNAVLINPDWGRISDFWPVQPTEMVHIFVRSPWLVSNALVSLYDK